MSSPSARCGLSAMASWSSAGAAKRPAPGRRRRSSPSSTTAASGAWPRTSSSSSSGPMSTWNGPIWPSIARSAGCVGRSSPRGVSGDRGSAVTFHNDRYRLDPSLIGWSDAQAFEEAMTAASAAADPDAALQQLERARSLYRGDYLDDCPFYGDSAQVEDRRELLRGRCVDLLLSLGRTVRGARRPSGGGGLLPPGAPGRRRRPADRRRGAQPARRLGLRRRRSARRKARIASAWRRDVRSSSRTRATFRGPRVARRSTRAVIDDHTSRG